VYISRVREVGGCGNSMINVFLLVVGQTVEEL